MESGRNYVYGTSAKKLEVPLYEQNKVQKKRVTTINYGKEKLMGVIVILVVFGFLFTLIYRYSMLTELEYKSASLNKEYSKLKDENAKLKIDIESNTDPFTIKKMAEKMGLQQPDKMQKVYIMVPKSDFTKISEQIKEEKKPINFLFAAVSYLLN